MKTLYKIGPGPGWLWEAIAPPISELHKLFNATWLISQPSSDDHSPSDHFIQIARSFRKQWFFLPFWIWILIFIWLVFALFWMWVLIWFWMWAFLWLRMLQLYDYESRRYDCECRRYECKCHSYMIANVADTITNVAVTWLRISQIWL